VATRRTTLKPHLNQIRAWVAEGATDIWIAHKLETTPASIARFRRQHALTRGDETPPVPASAPAVAASAAAGPAVRARTATRPAVKTPRAAAPAATLPAPAPAESAAAEPEAEAEVAPSAAAAVQQGVAATPARRRRRRGGRGRGEGREDQDTPVEFEGVFDHGEEGYGLWIDGAVRDASVYKTHWQGHAAVVVRITPDEITIRRAKS